MMLLYGMNYTLPLYSCKFSGVWTGPEGAIFEHSVRTPMVKAVLNKELK